MSESIDEIGTINEKRIIIPRGILVFMLAFLMYVIAALPIIIEHGGLFFYYGDYNVQQVPFYILAHRAVRNGQFLWNWNLDLGGSLIGDLSFYLMGSPFFWLTIPFSEKMLPYLMPYLMGLKYATAATTSFYYIKRYTKTKRAALAGALLYAFSGFDACNIVFNHFTDVVAFFPLLMIAFDELMMVDSHRSNTRFIPCGFKWVRFALTCTLMVTINYYFFFGQVVFLLIYAVIRYASSDTARNVRYMFTRALTGGITGAAIAAFYLLMALSGVAGNTRLDNILLGYDLIVYPSAKMYMDILKSLVMVPDIIGKGTLFYTGTVKNSSLAVYLPLFGIAGVIAYCHGHRHDWKKKLIITCAIIAAVPAFNAAFSLLNSQYYCRWFYMPILFMAIMTVQVMEKSGRDRVNLKYGTLVSTLIFLVIVGFAFLPSRDDDGNIQYMAMSENKDLLWKQIICTAVLYIVLIIIVFFIRSRKRRITVSLIATIVGSIAATMMVLINGSSLISDYGMKMWKYQMLDTSPDIDRDVFSRSETDSTSTNYEMVWNIPTVHCFLSTVPSEIFNFYEGAGGITRTVESSMPVERTGLRAILSARYYIENSDINKDGEFGKGSGTTGYLPYNKDKVTGLSDETAENEADLTSDAANDTGSEINTEINTEINSDKDLDINSDTDFGINSDSSLDIDSDIDDQHGFTIYENMNFIPMGFTFENYVRESDWDTINKANGDQNLVKAIILSDEDADKYGYLMDELALDELEDGMSDETFSEECNKRAETSCTEFTTNKNGFTAVTSDLPKENLIFFSMPAVAGLTATIDGQETDIITADYGMVAIDCPAGVHEISIHYLPENFYLGLIISIVAISGVAVYIIIFLKKCSAVSAQKEA